jgi:hypothetical protein
MAGTRKIICYMENFVIQRFVIREFDCIPSHTISYTNTYVYKDERRESQEPGSRVEEEESN